MSSRLSVGMLILATMFALPAYPLDLSLETAPYIESNLYTAPLLPVEGETVSIGIDLPLEQALAAPVVARLAIIAPDGATCHSEQVQLAQENGRLSGNATWTAADNGLYRVTCTLDPENAVQEESETNNNAELLLPVVVAERPLFFPWYRTSPWTRWANVVTSVDAETAPALAKRGVKALGWEYGGMSWSYFDNERLTTDRENAMAELENLFEEKCSRDLAPGISGLGLDETGGYPGTPSYLKSIASMRGLARAKAARPDHFFAVWHGGGVGDELLTLQRQGADLLLLETYVWRAVPNELGIEDIYQVIRDRLDPFVRGRDAFTPVYGNHCYTLISLDTSERPDWIDLGEMEQVVRFIRRVAPEMRGISFYNGGYGGYDIEPGPETDRIHERVVRTADNLCFKYFIRPCVTLQPESLWLMESDGQTELTAALSNIGSMDAGPVTVRFFQNGMPIGDARVEAVPAGKSRVDNRAMARLSIACSPGSHRFRAEIAEAGDATVLDPAVELERYVGQRRD